MTLLKLNALYLYLFPSIKSAVISPYYLYYNHEKGVKTVIVNNSTNINKKNNHLSTLIHRAHKWKKKGGGGNNI